MLHSPWEHIFSQPFLNDAFFTRAAKPAPQAKAAETAASEAAGGSGTKRVSAKDRAVPIVGKRRRVLAPRN